MTSLKNNNENYSGSICPKCGNSKFESVNETPKLSNIVLSFIRCEYCKTVVGVTDGRDLGDSIKRIMDRLDIKV